MSDSSAELADDSSATLLVTAGATTPLKYTCSRQDTTNKLSQQTPRLVPCKKAVPLQSSPAAG
jgi:hypothetical protein